MRDLLTLFAVDSIGSFAHSAFGVDEGVRLSTEKKALPKGGAFCAFYMFQIICALPSSRIRILWIIIMATAFFRP